MQDPDPPPLELMELLERLGLLLQTERRRQSSLHGLSEVHLALLHYLARCNRFSNTPRAVSEYLGITKGTISQSIKLLESRGLLRKRPDKEDRRIMRLALTRKGTALARSGSADAWHSVLARLPKDDLAVAARALQALLAGLQESNGYRTFLQCGTCRHLESTGSGHRCGLTGQPLKASDLDRICMEHQPLYPCHPRRHRGTR